MVKIYEAILVEGRYDKNTLSQIVDAPILETEGFGIFKDKAKMDMLRAIAQKRGLIVFTDADGAGLVIRNHIKSAIEGKYLKHAYIPEIMGKEKRKTSPGKAGMLGVEGMKPDTILECLRRAGATFLDEKACDSGGITKQDFVELGLSGCKNSALIRDKLAEKLGFPRNMSANALLQAANLLYTPQQLRTVVETLE